MFESAIGVLLTLLVGIILGVALFLGCFVFALWLER